MQTSSETSTIAGPARPFAFSGRIRSLAHAVRGIGLMLATQHNAWVHLVATVIVLLVGFAAGLSGADWCWIALAIVGVWMAEALNTAFELLCDVASPEFHPIVKQAKDVAAGAVLLAAVGAVVIGLLVFGQYVVR